MIRVVSFQSAKPLEFLFLKIDDFTSSVTKINKFFENIKKLFFIRDSIHRPFKD